MPDKGQRPIIQVAGETSSMVSYRSMVLSMSSMAYDARTYDMVNCAARDLKGPCTSIVYTWASKGPMYVPYRSLDPLGDRCRIIFAGLPVHGCLGDGHMRAVCEALRAQTRLHQDLHVCIQEIMTKPSEFSTKSFYSTQKKTTVQSRVQKVLNGSTLSWLLWQRL